jgi:hypothetical protein
MTCRVADENRAHREIGYQLSAAGNAAGKCRRVRGMPDREPLKKGCAADHDPRLKTPRHHRPLRARSLDGWCSSDGSSRSKANLASCLQTAKAGAVEGEGIAHGSKCAAVVPVRCSLKQTLLANFACASSAAARENRCSLQAPFGAILMVWSRAAGKRGNSAPRRITRRVTQCGQRSLIALALAVRLSNKSSRTAPSLSGARSTSASPIGSIVASCRAPLSNPVRKTSV